MTPPSDPSPKFLSPLNPRQRKHYRRLTEIFILYARFNAPFIQIPWGITIPGILLALVASLLSLTRSPEAAATLFEIWAAGSAVAIGFIGSLAVLTKASRTVPAQYYLSISAFLIHAMLGTSLAGVAIFLTPNPIPWLALVFIFGYALTMALINTLVGLYTVSLIFKLARI